MSFTSPRMRRHQTHGNSNAPKQRPLVQPAAPVIRPASNLVNHGMTNRDVGRPARTPCAQPVIKNNPLAQTVSSLARSYLTDPPKCPGFCNDVYVQPSPDKLMPGIPQHVLNHTAKLQTRQSEQRSDSPLTRLRASLQASKQAAAVATSERATLALDLTKLGRSELFGASHEFEDDRFGSTLVRTTRWSAIRPPDAPDLLASVGSPSWQDDTARFSTHYSNEGVGGILKRGSQTDRPKATEGLPYAAQEGKIQRLRSDQARIENYIEQSARVHQLHVDRSLKSGKKVHNAYYTEEPNFWTDYHYLSDNSWQDPRLNSGVKWPEKKLPSLPRSPPQPRATPPRPNIGSSPSTPSRRESMKDNMFAPRPLPNPSGAASSSPQKSPAPPPQSRSHGTVLSPKQAQLASPTTG